MLFYLLQLKKPMMNLVLNHSHYLHQSMSLRHQNKLMNYFHFLYFLQLTIFYQSIKHIFHVEMDLVKYLSKLLNRLNKPIQKFLHHKQHTLYYLNLNPLLLMKLQYFLILSNLYHHKNILMYRGNLDLLLSIYLYYCHILLLYRYD